MLKHRQQHDVMTFDVIGHSIEVCQCKDGKHVYHIVMLLHLGLD